MIFWGGSRVRLISNRQVGTVKVKISAYDVAARGLCVNLRPCAHFLVWRGSGIFSKLYHHCTCIGESALVLV